MATRRTILIVMSLLALFIVPSPAQKPDVLTGGYVAWVEYSKKDMQEYMNNVQIEMQGLKQRIEYLESLQ